MNRIKFKLAGVASALVLASIATGAQAQVNCNNGRSIGATTIGNNVLVSRGTCTLNGTTVRGNVRVLTGANLVTINAQIRGNIEGATAKSISVSGGRINGGIIIDGITDALTVQNVLPIGSGIEVKQAAGPVKLSGNSLQGPIIVEEFTGPSIELSSNITTTEILLKVGLLPPNTPAQPAPVKLTGNQAGAGILLESYFAGVPDTKGGFATIFNNDVKGGNLQLIKNGLELSVTQNEIAGDIQILDNIGGADVSLNVMDGNLQCSGNVPEPTAIGGVNTVGGNAESQCGMPPFVL